MAAVAKTLPVIKLLIKLYIENYHAGFLKESLHGNLSIMNL